MPLRAKSIQPRKEALIAAVAVFIITLVCNLAVTLIARTGLLVEIQSHLLSVASVASAMTDGDLHQTLTKPEQKNTPDYLQVQAPYRQILEANPNFRFVYTMVQKNGKTYFVIDTAPEKNPLLIITMPIERILRG